MMNSQRAFGLHLLQGFWITLLHFVRSYRNGGKNVFTVPYPEEKLNIPERFRVIPMLIKESDTGKIRCTACGICAKVCPPQCIWIVQEKNEAGKPLPQAKQFYIDIDVCMNCGLCAEFCPFDAIKMDQNFELSNTERDQSHIFDLQRLLVGTDYYAKTHPVAWAEEQEVASKKK